MILLLSCGSSTHTEPPNPEVVQGPETPSVHAIRTEPGMPFLRTQSLQVDWSENSTWRGEWRRWNLQVCALSLCLAHHVVETLHEDPAEKGLLITSHCKTQAGMHVHGGDHPWGLTLVPSMEALPQCPCPEPCHHHHHHHRHHRHPWHNLNLLSMPFVLSVKRTHRWNGVERKIPITLQVGNCMCILKTSLFLLCASPKCPGLEFSTLPTKRSGGAQGFQQARESLLHSLLCVVSGGVKPPTCMFLGFHQDWTRVRHPEDSPLWGCLRDCMKGCRPPADRHHHHHHQKNHPESKSALHKCTSMTKGEDSQLLLSVLINPSRCRMRGLLLLWLATCCEGVGAADTLMGNFWKLPLPVEGNTKSRISPPLCLSRQNVHVQGKCRVARKDHRWKPTLLHHFQVVWRMPKYLQCQRIPGWMRREEKKGREKQSWSQTKQRRALSTWFLLDPLMLTWYGTVLQNECLCPA